MSETEETKETVAVTATEVDVAPAKVVTTETVTAETMPGDDVAAAVAPDTSKDAEGEDDEQGEGEEEDEGPGIAALVESVRINSSRSNASLPLSTRGSDCISFDPTRRRSRMKRQTKMRISRAAMRTMRIMSSRTKTRRRRPTPRL
jgi:hypothetical protein